MHAITVAQAFGRCLRASDLSRRHHLFNPAMGRGAVNWPAIMGPQMCRLCFRLMPLNGPQIMGKIQRISQNMGDGNFTKFILAAFFVAAKGDKLGVKLY